MNMCTYIYKMVNLLKKHDNLHGITYRIKIMLNGIAIVKHGSILQRVRCGFEFAPLPKCSAACDIPSFRWMGVDNYT